MIELKLKAKGATHTGRVRANNQDAILVDQAAGLFVVADGMGGHAGGEIASLLATQTIRSEIINSSSKNTSLVSKISSAINKASQSIYEKALEEPGLRGMGTTATVAVFEGGRFHVGHVGDSRMYLLRCGFLYQITYDHSLVQEQVRAGLISKDEAEKHHLKNVITRSVGYQEDEDVDTFVFEVEEGDKIILCSDGLHGKISESELSDIVNKNSIDCTSQLIDLANHNGGEDNISVVLAEVVT